MSGESRFCTTGKVKNGVCIRSICTSTRNLSCQKVVALKGSICTTTRSLSHTKKAATHKHRHQNACVATGSSKVKRLDPSCGSLHAPASPTCSPKQSISENKCDRRFWLLVSELTGCQSFFGFGVWSRVYSSTTPNRPSARLLGGTAM